MPALASTAVRAALLNRPRVVAAPTPFITDTFTDTDTTVITSHTPDSGGTWTLDGGTAGTIVSNRLVQTSASLIYHSATPPSANYQVSMDCIVLSDNNNGGLGPVARWDAAGNNGYHGRINASGDLYQLYQILNNVFTLLDSSAATISGTKRLTLEVNGTSIRLLADGVQVAAATDSGISAAGKAGLRSSGLNTSSAGIVGDNFSAVGI